MNLMRDNEVTTDNAILEENTFRPDIGVLKGNTVRSITLHVQSQAIETPRELLFLHEEVKFSLDGCCANGQLFITSISHETCFRKDIPKDGTHKKPLMKAEDDIFQACCKCWFHMVKFHCGKKFEAAVDEWKFNNDLIVKANYFNAGEHFPRDERNNRTVQDRARTCYYQIPWNHSLSELTRDIATEAARKSNFFPTRHGASKCWIPRMILHKEMLDLKTHCMHCARYFAQSR